MASLRFMQLITQRLAKTFKDLNEAITMEITKMQNQPRSTNIINKQQIEEQSERKQIQEQIHNTQNIAHRSQQLDKDNNSYDDKTLTKKVKKIVSQRPKKPQNSFKIFLNDMKKQASNNDEPNFQNIITKIANKKWQSMTNEEKQTYEQLQQKQIDAYHKNLQLFYNANPQEKNKDIQKKQIKQEKKKLKIQEKQQQKQKQIHKQKQKEEEIPEDKKRNTSENQISVNKQISHQKKDKQKKERKQKEEKNNSKKKQGQQQFKVQFKKKQSKIRQKQVIIQKQIIIQKAKTQQNQQMRSQAPIIVKTLEKAPQQANLYKKQATIQALEINQNENVEVIQQQIVKPDIDQYFNLNNSSDSLGDI